MNDAVMDVRLARDTTRWFYVWMAGACVLIAVRGLCANLLAAAGAGYVHRLAAPASARLVVLRMALFFLLQTTFAALGRVDRHRAWGLLGISLATAMVFVGFAAADEVLAKRLAAGFGDRARAFHIVSTSMITLFGVFVFAAIAYVARPEIHKRLMLLATITVIPPAIARLFFAVNVGIGAGLRPGLGPPRSVESVMISALIADALILVAVTYDVRTRGRVHPAYLIGGVIIVVVQVLRVPAEHDTMVVRDRGLSRAVRRLRATGNGMRIDGDPVVVASGKEAPTHFGRKRSAQCRRAIGRERNKTRHGTGSR